MDERRVAQRHRVFKAAYVVFNNGRSTISCVVRNLSATGAKISVADVVGIPHSFELSLPGSGTRACRIVWDSATELGVAFIDQQATPGAEPIVQIEATPAHSR